MIKYKEKPSRLEYEFGHYIDPRLCGMIFALGQFVEYEFGIDLTVTCLMRSEEENAAMGGVEFSSHIYGRGGDLRSRIFTAEEKNKIENWLERSYGNNDHYWKFHDSGNGEHLHLQIRHCQARWDDTLKENFENKVSRSQFLTEAI